MLTDFQQRKLMKLFSMYDADCDGLIVGEDFDNVAKQLATIANWSARSPKGLTLFNQFSQEWQCLQKASDTDGDRKISLDEWFVYYEGVLGDEKQYQERVRSLTALVFDVFDQDGNQKMSQDEWANLLRVYHVSPIYVPAIFSRLDGDGDGFLSREDVTQAMDDFFYSNDPESPGNQMFGPY